MERFVRRTDYRALSLQDLLDAREQYQVHIANLETVVGTAVGRYRIRLNDANFHDQALNDKRPAKSLGARTLANSDIRPWSWPCVLVFVSEWIAPDELAKHPERTVPPLLYLPDGRQVRTCVVLAQRRVANLPPEDAVAFSTSLLGPGFQVFAQGQGVTRMGVASSIVADDAGAYLLTTGHVAGAPESEVYCMLRGRRKVVGISEARSVAALPLAQVYPGFAGTGAQLKLDAGLVRLADVNRWTTRALGVGVMGPPIDLSADTLNLNLIGCPVFTELPGGRRVEGAVHALFYRHANRGGADTLSELLIGPRSKDARVETRPGDSGVLWFWDHVADAKAEPDPNAADAPAAPGSPAQAWRPLAIQWGGQGFFSGDANPAEFALATSLSAICKALGVEVVRDWASDDSRYWAKVGHYKIGYAACFALQSAAAQTLFKANATSISVSDEDILGNRLPSAANKTEFIALADVPDLVWRARRGKDKANHFADMDEPGRGLFAGKTLLQLWGEQGQPHAQALERFLFEHRPGPQAAAPRCAAVSRGPALRRDGGRGEGQVARRLRVRGRRAGALRRRRLPAAARLVPAPRPDRRRRGRRRARRLRGRYGLGARAAGGGRRQAAGRCGAAVQAVRRRRGSRRCSRAADAPHHRQAAARGHPGVVQREPRAGPVEGDVGRPR